MNQQMTRSHSSSTSLRRWFMSRRNVIYAAASVWIGLLLCPPIAQAATLPTADEIMKELHLSDKDQARVRQGEIVD